MIVTFTIAACMFVAGFGYGWCLRGDRALKRERRLEAELGRVYAELSPLRARENAQRRRSVQQLKEKHRWN